MNFLTPFREDTEKTLSEKTLTEKILSENTLSEKILSEKTQKEVAGCMISSYTVL